MVLKLYKLNASAPVRSVLMTIEALNLEDVEYVDVNLLVGEHLEEEFIKMNPQHTIPTLKDDDFVIWDSHAIVTYLVNMYSDDNSLYPSDPRKRAIIDQRLHFDSGVMFPAFRDIVVPILFGGEKEFRPENLVKIKAAYNFMNKFLTSPWLAGDEVTLADICCIATVSTMNEALPVTEARYPNLLAWMQRCEDLDFYQKGNIPGLEMFRQLLQSKLI